MKYGRILLLALAAMIMLLAGTSEVSAAPGDEDDDGLITGPQLAGNTTFRGCFASGGPDGGAGTDGQIANKNVDNVTDALDQANWNPANQTDLKQATQAQIESCIDAAQAASVAGDEFVFYYSGHGGDGAGAAEGGEGGGGDNFLDLGGNGIGGDDVTDDELADILDGSDDGTGFANSVTITVILTSCKSNTFTDGDDDIQTSAYLAVITAGDAPVKGAATDGSPFDKALSDAIKNFTADTNDDGIITAHEAAKAAASGASSSSGWCGPTGCPGGTCTVDNQYTGPVTPAIDACPTRPGAVGNNGCPYVGGTVDAPLADPDAIAQAAEGSGSSLPYAAIAGGAAATAIALVAGGWYVRRRLS